VKEMASHGEGYENESKKVSVSWKRYHLERTDKIFMYVSRGQPCLILASTNIEKEVKITGTGCRMWIY
jgi:hypothetical protein